MAMKLEIIRPDDLLNLEIEIRNLRLDDRDPQNPTLIAEDATQSALLIVQFPPQTIAEEATFEPSATQAPPEDRTKPYNQAPPAVASTLPVRARLGGASRLVFEIPANSNPQIPFTIAGLLDWTELSLKVSPVAAVPPDLSKLTPQERANLPAIAAPQPTETAIELPYRLILSPNRNVVWKHETAPKTHAGRTELWHTRLALKSGERTTELSRRNPAPLRAIWSPDYSANPANKPPFGALEQWVNPNQPGSNPATITAMNRRDRHEIVILTSAFSGFIKERTGFADFDPTPIQAEQVMLSALGGWLKSRGNWEPPTEWIPRRLIPIDPIPLPQPIPRPIPRVDRLMDFLNPTIETEDDTDELFGGIQSVAPFTGRPGDTLNLSEWVHVATQGRDHYVRIVYEGHLYPFGNRAALIKVTERKFKDVNGSPIAYLAQRMFIVVREPLKDYSKAPLENGGRKLPTQRIRLTTLVTPDIDLPAAIAGTEYAFWVRVGTKDFRFHGVAQDSAAHPIDFTTPLIFVPNSDQSRINAVRTAHQQDLERGACQIPGQSVTYAARKPGDAPDNTTITTQALYFDIHTAPVGKEFGGFLPQLTKAKVNLAEVDELLGKTTLVEIKYYKDYLNNPNFLNTGTGLFAELLTPAVSKFSADKAGGITTPDLAITGITRELGAIAGKKLADVAADIFDPSDFFNDVKDTAKLFGSLNLMDLIPTGGSASKNTPKIQAFPLANPPYTALTWEPTIRDLDFGILSFEKTDATKLIVRARIEKALTAGASAKAEFSGALNDFTLNFLNVVAIKFLLFSFKSETGKKSDVTVELDPDTPVKFQGDLEFVEEIKELIPPGLFGDGSSLDITTKHIRAGFGIGLPPVAIGIFALKDVTLSAALELPFANGNPLFDFGISERHHPFNLTVAFFGGGGFFNLQLDTLGVRKLEASLEFGASASINLGVASGGVHMMAGIYFKLERSKTGDDEATLSGYFRLGGELSILGIISISLEFVLSFTYETATKKATGRATLTVKVEVLCFSKSVEITVEKKFGGANGDPVFAQTWDTPSIWDEYAAAFA